MKNYIKQAYDKSVLINNNGSAYEFFTRVDRRPTKIYMALGDDDLSRWAMERGKYMDNDELKELWEMINRDKKPFWHCKEDVIRDWEDEKKWLLSLPRGNITDVEAKRRVNRHIAKEKDKHQKEIKKALSGYWHRDKQGA